MNPNTSTTGNMMTCSTAYQPAHTVPGHREGAAMDATVKAWTDTGPLPYRDDPMPPPWFWATDLYRRKRRRPRCGEIVED